MNYKFCRALTNLTLSTFLLSSGLALAGDDDISTDRPDFVESSKTVGKGRVQIETSFAYERGQINGTKASLSSTPTLLKVGVADDWELRMETDGALTSRESGVSTSGTADTAIGVKWQFGDADEKTGKPGMALLAHLDLATGSVAFRGQGARPSLRWVTEWELADDMAIGVMPGVFRDQGPNGKFTGFIMAATVSKGWTDRFRTFIELAGRQITSKANGGNIVTVDLGAAYLMNKNLQWDIALFHGLNEGPPDDGITVGLSARF